MTPLALELTKLIGKKEWSSGLVMKDNYGIYLTLVGERQFDGDDDVYLYAPEHKEISHWFNNKEYTQNKEGWEIIGHPATLSDLHRWMDENYICWRQFGYESIDGSAIWIADKEIPIQYDSSKELLEQSEETLTQILSLIKS